MKKCIYPIILMLCICDISCVSSRVAQTKNYVQEAEPYISRFISWKIPTVNTDGTQIKDFDGINIYYSFNGPTNFIKGVDSSNFLAHIQATTNEPISLDELQLLQERTFKWNGSFHNTNLWIRATALDDYGNESEFSEAAVAAVSNVDMTTNAASIIRFVIEMGGVSIWITESDATEILEVSDNLVEGDWTEVGPLLIWYNLNTLGPDKFIRIKRSL